MNLEIGYDLDTLLGSVAFDYKLTLGENATGNTPMYWGNVISGEAYYYYIDLDNVKTTKKGNYYFNSNSSQNYAVFDSEKFSIYGFELDTPTSSLAPTVSASTSETILKGGGTWRYRNSMSPPYSGTGLECKILFLNDSSGVGSSTPTYNTSASETTTWRTTIATSSVSKIHYTTIPNLSSVAPCLPISGRTMSYNDVRQYVVNEYNDQNPSETISVDDLPAFDDDEIEPTYDMQPFSLDYDEILGEKEMESIIAETRYILDTTPYEIESVDYAQAVSEPYEELKKVAVLDADTKTAMSKIYDVALAMTENDFLPLYAFGAILSIVMWFVFRR